MGTHAGEEVGARPRLLAWLALGLAVLVLTEAARLYVSYRFGGVELALSDALATAAIDWAPWLVLAPFVLALARRFDLAPGRRWRDFLVHAVAAPAFGLLHVAAFAAATVASRGDAWRPALRSALIVKLSPSTATYLCLVLGAAAWSAQARAAAVEHRRERLARQLDAARLQALRARLQPHFLFNALNGIAGLIGSDPELAEELIARLGALLRRALARADAPDALGTLAEERAALEDYLAIERARLGARLRVEIDIPDALGGLHVPPFLLQPIVENAVLHGAARRAEGGSVTVVARRVEAAGAPRLALSVEDDGPGPGPPAVNGADQQGYGLAATRERLALHFGAAAEVLVSARAGGGASVTLWLPCGP